MIYPNSKKYNAVPQQIKVNKKPNLTADFPLMDTNDDGISLRIMTIIPEKPATNVPKPNLKGVRRPLVVSRIPAPNKTGKLTNRFKSIPLTTIFAVAGSVFCLLAMYIFSL
jgi:hypothetical protein